MDIKNKIYIDGKLFIKQEKHGKYIDVILEDGTIIHKSQINGAPIQIQCNVCGKLVTLSFYNALMTRNYECQHCNKLGEKSPMYGKHHSVELRKRLSEERKGKWYIGEKNPMYGRSIKECMTAEKYEEWKQHVRNSALKGEKNPMYGRSVESIVGHERWREIVEKGRQTSLNKSPEEKAIISKKLSDAQKRYAEAHPEEYREMKHKAGIISQKSHSKYSMTSIELKVQNWLKNNDVAFEYSCIMGGANDCWQYDFIIRDKRILIEVQGDYWHGNPLLFNDDGSDGKRKLNVIQKTKMEKDILKEKFAINHNFHLIKIWEHDINNNNFTVLEKILEKK